MDSESQQPPHPNPLPNGERESRCVRGARFNPMPLRKSSYVGIGIGPVSFGTL